MSAKGGPVLTFSFPGGSARPISPPASYATGGTTERGAGRSLKCNADRTNRTRLAHSGEDPPTNGSA